MHNSKGATMIRETVLSAVVVVFLFSPAVSQQWDQVGPYGGYIQSLAKDGSGNVYAGTLFGGIFKTTNNGDSWVQIYNDTSIVDVRSLVINENGHIYAGLDPGFMRSTNGGATWQRIANSLNTRTVATLLVLPNDNIFAGALSGGLYRSTDNGQTFSLYTNGMSASSIRKVARNPVNGDLLVATNGSGVFRSTDEGANWVAVNTGISTTLMNSVAISPNGDLYASGDTRIFRSTDNGANWIDQLAPAATYWDFAFAGSSVFVAFSSSTVVGGGVSVSTNNGATWTSESGLANIPFNRIIPNGTTVIAGCLGWGTYRTSVSAEGRGVWTHRVNGMNNTHVYALNEGTDGALYAGTRYSGVFKSTDNGLTWGNASIGLPHDWINGIAVNPVNGNIFAATNSFKYRSTDNGASWQQVHSGGATAIASNSSGDVFAGLGSQILKSSNNGTTWMSQSISPAVHVSEIEFVGETIYVATGNISGTTGHGVYRSTDNGGTWGAFNNGLPNLNVTTIAVDTNSSQSDEASAGCDGQVILGTKGFGVHRLDGSVWVPDGLEGEVIRHLRNFSRAAPSYSLAVSARFLMSRDLTCSWDPLYDQARDVTKMYRLETSQDGAHSATILLVATNGKGIHRGVNVISAVPEKGDLQLHFSLLQNYPNPFNPSTTIMFTVGTRGYTSLRVFDLLGREVAVLVDEVKSPGEYSVTLDGSRLTGGVYFYRLQVINAVKTRKLVLLK